MPRSIVTIPVAAHVHYSTFVDADSADQAKQAAREHRGELEWHDIGTTDYDDRDWRNLEPAEVEDDCSLHEDPLRQKFGILDDFIEL